MLYAYIIHLRVSIVDIYILSIANVEIVDCCIAVMYTRPPSLVSVGGDGWIRLWNIEKKIQVGQVTRDGGYGVDLHCVSVVESNVDKKAIPMIITGDANGVVTIYDTNKLSAAAMKTMTKTQEASPYTHTNRSRDGFIKDYIVEQISFQAHIKGVTGVHYASANGGMVITSASDGILALWTLDGIQVGIFGK